MNAALLGLSQKEMERKFDEIVAFAELEQFIDNQVKFYSSGMYVRLGFAVAVNVEPDVLVIDEVLAVGDENFQRKCLDRIKTFQDGRQDDPVRHPRSGPGPPDLRPGGRPRRGTGLDVGPPGEAIRRFREHLLEVGTLLEIPPEDPTAQVPAVGPRRLLISSVEAVHPGTGSRPFLEPTRAARCPHRVRDGGSDARRRVRDGDLRHRGEPDLPDRHRDTRAAFRCEGRKWTGRLLLRAGPLMDGTFSVNVGIQSKGGVVYDWREQATSFEVMNPGRSTGVIAMPVHAEIRSAALS